jgi:glucokinase
VRNTFAGIDVGGTGTRFVIRERGRVIAQSTVATAELAAGRRGERLSRLVTTLTSLLPRESILQGVGIGASGPVDVARGVVNNPDTLPGFSGFPLVAGLKRRLRVPVTIDNDAMTAAIAEQRIGVGRKASRMLMVTLGTGVGVALVVNGAPFRGLHGAHPEGSHIPIVDQGPRCYCGIDGCWETLASRQALQSKLRTLLPTSIAERDVVAHAASLTKRPRIRAAFFEYGVLVGRGLLALHALYMPDLTVIGGSAAEQFRLFMPGIRAYLRKSNQVNRNVRIEPCALGDSAGAIGAAIIAGEYR